MNAIAQFPPRETANNDAALVAVLESSFYPGASPQSIGMVLAYCRAAGLDPMQRPVHIVPMWDERTGRMRDVVMPGIGLYRTQAARTGQYAGISEPEFGPDITETIGSCLVTFPAWCRVTVLRTLPNGQTAEFPAREYWRECFASKGGKARDPSPNKMWGRRPYGMLAKCAEAQALRRAFPELGSAPTAEEMLGQAIELEAEASEPPPAPAPALEQQPPYPADAFAANIGKWRDLVDSGRRRPDEILAIVGAKYALNDGQRAAIVALGDLAEAEQNTADWLKQYDLGDQ